MFQIIDVFIVPCAMRSWAYIHTHSLTHSLRACLHYTVHTGERRSISLSCHHCLTVSCESRHILKPLQSMMHTSVEHVILCSALCCVCFSAVFKHIHTHTRFSLPTSLSFVPLVRSCVVNELNRSSRKTEPNRCVRTRFDNSMSKREKATTRTAITRWTLSACVSAES